MRSWELLLHSLCLENQLHICEAFCLKTLFSTLPFRLELLKYFGSCSTADHNCNLNDLNLYQKVWACLGIYMEICPSGINLQLSYLPSKFSPSHPCLAVFFPYFPAPFPIDVLPKRQIPSILHSLSVLSGLPI